MTVSTRPKLRPEIKQRWLDALRSGRYQQGTGYLGYQDDDEEPHYCCLGVLCEIAVEEGVVDVESMGSAYADAAHHDTVRRYGQLETVMPPAAVTRWAYGDLSGDGWAVDMPLDPDNPEAGDVGLSELNDEHGYTFERIADVIEEYL